MASVRAQRKQQIAAEFDARFARLWQMAAEELRALPESRTESVSLNGKDVQFTTFREPKDDGTVLIVLRSDAPILLGMTMGAERGLIVAADGAKSEAPDKALWSY